MSFSINDFLAQLNKSGVAYSSLFEVQVTPPSGLQVGGQSAVNTSDMVYRAQNVNWPGRGITAAELKYYGPTQKIAMDSTFNDVTVEFLLSESLYEYDFFESWQDIAVGKYRESSDVNADAWLRFFDDYKGTVTISHFNEREQLKYKVNLVDAFPINVGDIQRDWGQNDLIRVPITFTYRYVAKAK